MNWWKTSRNAVSRETRPQAFNLSARPLGFNFWRKAMITKLSDQPWYAMGDPWVLTQSEWSPAKNVYYETIFTQANGYMGIRGYTEEVNDGLRSFREGYLAGVFGHVDEAALEQMRVNYEWPVLAMITLPELFACSITLNGEAFTLSEGTITFFSRSLN